MTDVVVYPPTMVGRWQTWTRGLAAAAVIGAIPVSVAVPFAVAQPVPAVVVALATFLLSARFGGPPALRWTIWSGGSVLAAYLCSGPSAVNGAVVVAGMLLAAFVLTDLAVFSRSSMPWLGDVHPSIGWPILLLAAIPPASMWLGAGPTGFTVEVLVAVWVARGFGDPRHAPSRWVPLIGLAVIASAAVAAPIDRPPVFVGAAGVAALASTGGRPSVVWRRPGRLAMVMMAAGTFWAAQLSLVVAGSLASGSFGYPGWKALISTRPHVLAWSMGLTGVPLSIAGLMAVGASWTGWASTRRALSPVLAAIAVAVLIGAVWQQGLRIEPVPVSIRGETVVIGAAGDAR